MNPQILSEAQHLINQNHFVTVATATLDGQPSAATVFCVMNEHGTLYFPTRSQSKKYKNILVNPHVSVVCTQNAAPVTLQIYGSAREVTTDELSKVMETIMKASMNENTVRSHWLPPIHRMNNGQFTFIKIEPSWMRISDFRDEEHHGEGYVRETQ